MITGNNLHHFEVFEKCGVQEGLNGSKDIRHCITPLFNGRRAIQPISIILLYPINKTFRLCRTNTRSSPKKILQADSKFYYRRKRKNTRRDGWRGDDVELGLLTYTCHMSPIQIIISIKSLLRLRTFTRNTPYEVLFADNAY